MQPVIIPSRDGLRLNGYLTLPATEAGSGRMPLVLVIHGGPYARQSGASIRPINGSPTAAMRC